MNTLFTQLLAVLGSIAVVAAANSVTFISLDEIDRTVYFTPSVGCESVDSVQVPAGANITAEIPQSWIGNWRAVSADATPDLPGGMLGEVAFQGWNDLTYFDVSAIVNPDDHDGVKEMWPVSGQQPRSGCEVFPCDNAYYLPDDIQTKATPETDLVCTLGNGPSPLGSIPDPPSKFKRSFILGKF